ncbi:MAG: YcgN family cysteine cluster protein [Pseudolabrys sp.]
MADPAGEAVPFWRRKRLDQMTRTEWESLCDGCGRCCLNKLEEEDTREIFFTDVVCKLFDAGTCRCSDYKNRQRRVPDCVKLTPEEVADYNWLPPTCAYRLLAEGKELMWWHPLISGSTETVHEAGVSLRGRTIFSERGVPDADLEDHIVKWPGRVPKAAKKEPAKKKRGQSSSVRR